MLEFHQEINEHLPYLEEEPCKDLFIAEWYYNLTTGKGGTIMYIAEEEGEIAGACAGRICTQKYAKKPVYGAEEFWYVRKSWRNTRVGWNLYKMLFGWFKKNYAKRVTMTYYPFAENVRKFYHKQGYKELETVMVKEL